MSLLSATAIYHPADVVLRAARALRSAGGLKVKTRPIGLADDEGPSGVDAIWLVAGFGLASLAVVGGVWLVGAVGTWWVLAPAMVIHLTMTTFVLYGVLNLASRGATVDEVTPAPKASRKGEPHAKARPGELSIARSK